MKKIRKLSSLLLLVALIVSGCDSKSRDGEPLDIKFGYVGDLFKYKDAYVGDNSAVGNIVSRLKNAERFKGFELKTDEEPYGIILNYSYEESEQDYKDIVIYNATFLFTLLQNADWIMFNFENEEYTITKDKLKNWYGEDFTGMQSEDEVKTFIQKHSDDENKVDELFN
ncbi:DUF4825 domain-containing protein [Sporosarcina luteola]|uniref:DUF4825 domain-containing protein n=1 Tax=Sporosarcina luteola TaxID=582850 RepID=UPI00203C3DC8|nr:DUF4825 domain-containing protein [Sporosarcina luteola]MCM3745189.1 DUF4825 domain-containing protein [Sporosarcina luteola]